MIKNLIIAAAMLACAPAVAEARDFYGVVRAGITTDTSVGPIDLSDGDTYGIGVGTSVGPVRVEASLDHSSWDVFPGVSANANTVAVTGNLDFQVTHDSSISIGAGPAYTDAEANFVFGSFDDSGWGYVAQASYSRRLTSNIIGEVQARYTDVSFDSLPDANSTAVTVGLRFGL